MKSPCVAGLRTVPTILSRFAILPGLVCRESLDVLVPHLRVSRGAPQPRVLCATTPAIVARMPSYKSPQFSYPQPNLRAAPRQVDLHASNLTNPYPHLRIGHKSQETIFPFASAHPLPQMRGISLDTHHIVELKGLLFNV
jgi:hypothetical protein